jgi:hypothetical protein
MTDGQPMAGPPFACLRDILERMSDGHPMSQLDDLLPWNWQKTLVRH